MCRNYTRIIKARNKKVPSAGSLWVPLVTNFQVKLCTSLVSRQRTCFDFEGLFSAFLPFPGVTCCLEASRICITHTHTERSHHHHGEPVQDVYAYNSPCRPPPTARSEQKHGNASSLGCRRVLLTLSQSLCCLSGWYFSPYSFNAQ